MSLVLLIFSLCNLGTARTGAYFAAAPFIGSAVAIAMYGQPIGWVFWIEAIGMAAGVWLPLTEDHEHDHVHEPLVHSHAHSHDAPAGPYMSGVQRRAPVSRRTCAHLCTQASMS